MADDDLGFSLQSILSEDTTGLRSKYYSYLDKGLNASSEPAPLDDSALLWRGIIPAIATALFTKGKAAQFAGEPLSNVLVSEEKKAEERQKLDIETNLKRAGLLQETIEQRDKAVLDEFQRVKQEELRRDLAQESNDTRRDIAAQSSADRMAIAQMMEAGRDEGRDQRRERDRKAEARQLTADFENEANRLGIQKQISSVKDVDALLKGPQNAITQGQLSTKVLRMSSEVGNAAVKERAITLPPTMQSKVIAWQNWIENGATGPLPDSQLDGLKELTKIYEQSVNDKVLSLRENRKKLFKGTSLLDESDFDSITNELGSQYLTGSASSSKDQLKALLRNNPQLIQGQQ